MCIVLDQLVGMHGTNNIVKFLIKGVLIPSVSLAKVVLIPCRASV